MDAFSRGNSTEAAVLGILLARGIPTALPLGVKRYDLIVELDGKLLKAQVKTGRISQGSLAFPVCTVHPVTGLRRPYTADQVDIFLVYNRITGKVYKVPFTLVGTTECRLRIDPTKNHRTKDVHQAKEFEL
jgi:hypothetical protein